LGKELGNLNSVRRGFSKLLSKIPTGLRNVAFLPHEKKGSLVRILAVATVIVSLSLTLVAFGVINHSFIISSGGRVNLPVGVGFYWDSDCSSPVSFIDWGDIQPGSTVNVTLFVKNTGGQAISLNITAENWNPIETTSYMTFDSDCTGQTIDPQETVQITLSLTTSSSIETITSFSFDINVTLNPI
jgi:hypothetical protein